MKAQISIQMMPRHAGEEERIAPAVRDGERAQQHRHHHRADRAAAERECDAARTLRWRQRIHGRAQSARERAAFADAQNGARHSKAGKAGHPRMRHARSRPHRHCQQHALAQPDVVDHRAPDRVAERVGEEEERCGGREVLVREAGVLDDGRRQDVEHLAIDERQPRAECHAKAGHPHVPAGRECGVGRTSSLCCGHEGRILSKNAGRGKELLD